MSDSDDTDILLLIPPYFFLVDDHYLDYPERDYHLSFHENSIPEPESVTFMSSQSELESLNARLAQIENDFAASSDISSIARCTVRSREANCNGRSPRHIVHSTPICEERFSVGGNTNGILQEIDAYLSKKPQEYPPRRLDNEQRSQLGATTTRLSNWTNHAPGDNEPLMSLSEILGGDDHGHQTTLAEETLRRKHCERTINALQGKLLEYQQKIAVAIDVDRKKDAIIQKHVEENSRTKEQVHKLAIEVQSIEAKQHRRIQGLQEENASLTSQKKALEDDISVLRQLTIDLEEKNSILEVKLAKLMRASDEAADVYKKQIADLEVRISNSHHSRGQLEEQLSSLKVELATAKAAEKQACKEKDVCAKELALRQEEMQLLRQQKCDALDKYREERCRFDILSNEKKSLQENLQELKRKETNVLKELEAQRVSLKSYYQQQLEHVISQKLEEFQTQLDSVEANLRMQGKEREKLIAERAIKQIEIINAKNEQEIGLIQQKNSEEVELYRIQLENASKTIEELQEKLDAYRSRRADIASKLHNIMESQWQKALEVLTSPNAEAKPNALNADTINPSMVDGVNLSASNKRDNPENESFETPTSSRNRRLNDKRKEAQLQAYIQLLLNKSPRDLDNLEEVLQLQKASHDTQLKSDNHLNKSRRDQKPPWK